jgi:phosphoglycerate dehydrogenase-like enzyme
MGQPLKVALYANVSARQEVAERWEILQALLPPGIEVLKVDPGALAPGEDAVALLQHAEAIVCLPYGGVVVDDALVAQLPRLRHVQLLSAGYSEVTPEVEALAARGVTVANNGGSNAISVAEHAVGLIIAVYRQLLAGWVSAREGQWRAGLSTRNVFELSGKCVGVIGFGNVGRQLARKLSGFDVRIIYHDVVELMPGRDLELGATAVDLPTLLAEADVVSMHVPLDSVTQGMADAAFFAAMKPTAVFVNTCRGGVQLEAALVEALRSGQILGAGLDVLAQEPPDPTHPLLHLDNAVVTPHWAGASEESNQRAIEFALANLDRLREARPLLSVVEPAGVAAPHTLEAVVADGVDSVRPRL